MSNTVWTVFFQGPLHTAVAMKRDPALYWRLRERWWMSIGIRAYVHVCMCVCTYTGIHISLCVAYLHMYFMPGPRSSAAGSDSIKGTFYPQLPKPCF